MGTFEEGQEEECQALKKKEDEIHHAYYGAY